VSGTARVGCGSRAADALVVMLTTGLLGGCAATGVLGTDPAVDLTSGPAAAFAREHGLGDLERTVVRVEPGGNDEERDGAARHALTFEVLVADTDGSRGRGLQGVASLPSDVGMLFVFPGPSGPEGRPGFWMLGTLLPLDIAFAEGGIVVGVSTMTPCLAPPCPITHPGVPYDTALEVAAGVLVEAGVAPGDRIVVGPDGDGTGR